MLPTLFYFKIHYNVKVYSSIKGTRCIYFVPFRQYYLRKFFFILFHWTNNKKKRMDLFLALFEIGNQNKGVIRWFLFVFSMACNGNNRY